MKKISQKKFYKLSVELLNFSVGFYSMVIQFVRKHEPVNNGSNKVCDVVITSRMPTYWLRDCFV